MNTKAKTALHTREARYFGMSTDLGKYQIEDYAQRKGMTVAQVEKWLSSWLGY